MRRRKALRLKSSAGQIGSQGVRNSRLCSRSAAHSVWSVTCGVRSITPSPMTEGSGSAKLMVRKNAIVPAQRQRIPAHSRDSENPERQKDWLLAFAGTSGVKPKLPSCGLAVQSFRNGHGAFKPRSEAEQGNRRLAAEDQGPPGGARALDHHRIDFLDQFVERNGPSEG